MPTQPSPRDPRQPKIPRIPELVGATSNAINLGNGTTHTSFAMQAPTGPARLNVDEIANWMPRRVFLNIENMTSKARAPDYDVYLNLPPNDAPEKHPELRADRVPMFGLVEASTPDETHPANGLYCTLDVTDLYARLAALPGWDARNLRVTFVPTGSGYAADIRVSRVSLSIE